MLLPRRKLVHNYRVFRPIEFGRSTKRCNPLLPSIKQHLQESDSYLVRPLLDEVSYLEMIHPSDFAGLCFPPRVCTAKYNGLCFLNEWKKESSAAPDYAACSYRRSKTSLVPSPPATTSCMNPAPHGMN